MNKKRLQPALTLWHNWKRLAFTSQTFLQKKQHNALCAPEYDPSQEDNIVLLSGEKDLPEIPKKVWMYWDNEYLPKSMALNIKKIRQDNPDHEIHLLNRLTIKEVLPDLRKGVIRIVEHNSSMEGACEELEEGMKETRRNDTRVSHLLAIR